ncbi:hypothetical protein Pedsa_0499 [Pseudopedobacter saltans DSM 12145]|uniref:Secretion system C-terminal sorting domain-containing protein n=1 Tax=Pseudopedobacter saltans (strain ATCC 51119 / DSM 12145 / JCM 21818 / CCUG 39354 / LMG 10337 / NBRC 100064 / NCIMB 13643) TaxID=762903 RepID=F0S6K4_PSESL|nr:M43 family zinc metalloprotease [Pseudopedobacter saltans]ADY51080.1 hypothetical protein Pedsa_0499 [Pseudopedobacter saltans DSM 12145]
MKKIYCFFLLLFFINHNLYSQIQECEIFKSTNISSKEEGTSSKSATISSYLSSTYVICINVKFHIIRKTDGTGGFDSSSLDCIIKNLNEAYNKHNFRFNYSGYDYINNSEYYDIPIDKTLSDITVDNISSTSNVSNMLNIYLVNSARFAGIASLKNNWTVIRNDYALETTTVHEVGHCFNLKHTFNEAGLPAETALNCTTAADELCDTPPDYGISDSDVNYFCGYSGTSSGDFSIIIKNYMSYSRKSCRTEFTPGQVNRMRTAFSNTTKLQNIVGTNCLITSISGLDRICNAQNYSLLNAGTIFSVYWTTSGDISISGSNSSSTVTVVPNPSSSGAGILTGTYTTSCGTFSVSKSIVNSNNFNTGIIGGESYYVPTNSQLLFYVSNYHPDAINYTWSLSPSYYGSISGMGASADAYIYNTGSFSVICTITTPCGSYDVYDFHEAQYSPFSLSVYPNPTSTELNIEIKSNKDDQLLSKMSSSKIIEATLYNNYGENVLSGKSLGKLTLNTSNLPNGTYYLHFKDYNGKLIKQQIIIKH